MNKILSLRRDRTTESQPNNRVATLGNQVAVRAPNVDDGFAVHKLVAMCPPLDLNSRYFYLVQCTDFADTCIVAERDGEVVGWISGYRRPGHPNVLFVWQIAVHPDARGHSLGTRLLRALLSRPNCENVETIQTSVAEDNIASLSVFKSFAESLRARLVQHNWLDCERHFHGNHDSEQLLTIGPIDTSQVSGSTNIA